MESQCEARFSASIQTGPEAHPASYKIGTGYFPGAQRPERGCHHPTLSIAEVKERVELYFYSPPERAWPVLRVIFTFTYINLWGLNAINGRI
jgi:hypothetical protein